MPATFSLLCRVTTLLFGGMPTTAGQTYSETLSWYKQWVTSMYLEQKRTNILIMSNKTLVIYTIKYFDPLYLSTVFSRYWLVVIATIIKIIKFLRFHKPVPQHGYEGQHSSGLWIKFDNSLRFFRVQLNLTTPVFLRPIKNGPFEINLCPQAQQSSNIATTLPQRVVLATVFYQLYVFGPSKTVTWYCGIQLEQVRYLKTDLHDIWLRSKMCKSSDWNNCNKVSFTCLALVLFSNIPWHIINACALKEHCNTFPISLE